MNTNKTITIPFAFAALALFAQVRLAAQTWETVDDFQYILGKSSWAYGVRADSLGNLYVAGGGLDSANVRHALVMHSPDQGITWQTAEDFVYQPGANTTFTSIGIDDAQNLYALGSGRNGAHWLVRKSADSGATWQTVDDFSYAPGWLSGPEAGFATDDSGNIFVAGYAFNPSGPQSGLAVWIVRRSSDAGATWSTVDTFQYNGYSTPAVGIVSSPAGVFVAGFGGLHWFVRRTADGGQTWTTVDDFAYPNASGSGLGGLTLDNMGNLFTVGRVTATTASKRGSTSTSYWVVRKGMNIGSTWSTSAILPDAGFPEGVCSDSAGNLYVVGGHSPNWVVRKSTNQGINWSTVDSLTYGNSSLAYGCADDGLGNVYVCGIGSDPATGNHWLVRKASP